MSQFNTKKPSIQHIRQFNTKKIVSSPLNIELFLSDWCISVELTIFSCWTHGFVEKTFFVLKWRFFVLNWRVCWTDAFWGLKRSWTDGCVTLRGTHISKIFLRMFALHIMSDLKVTFCWARFSGVPNFKSSFDFHAWELSGLALSNTSSFAFYPFTRTWFKYYNFSGKTFCTKAGSQLWHAKFITARYLVLKTPQSLIYTQYLTPILRNWEICALLCCNF